jgi:tetratricopeptide (TPR) repeat protein
MQMKKYLTAVVLLTFIILSFLRNAVWKDEWTLYADITSKAPNKPRSITNLGRAALERKDFAAALALFLRARDIYPYHSAISVNLGIAYVGLGQWTPAKQRFEEAIAFDASESVAYYNLGLLYYKIFKDNGQALVYLLKARDLNPNDPEVHLSLGLVYRELGKHDLAQKEFILQKTLR